MLACRALGFETPARDNIGQILMVKAVITASAVRRSVRLLELPNQDLPKISCSASVSLFDQLPACVDTENSFVYTGLAPDRWKKKKEKNSHQHD